MAARLLAAGVVLTFASAAWGGPIVALDADPTLIGVQNVGQVTVGDLFEIDLSISDVSPADPLQSFDVQLSFDPLAVRAVDVTGGDFLIPPVVTFEELIGVATVDFAEVSIGLGGASGGGVLATFRFEALTVGGSDLALPMVLLGGPFGDPIPVLEVQSARVAISAVPEPGAALLFLLGLLICLRGGGSLQATQRARGPQP